MAKSTTKPMFAVNAYHVGFDQAFGNLQRLPNGVLKGTMNNGGNFYKFRFSYSIYDKQATDSAKNQRIDVTVFGTRYDWIATNLGQYDRCFVTGAPNFDARPDKNDTSKAYVNVNIEDAAIELVNRYQQNGAAASTAPATQAVPAPVAQAAPAAPPAQPAAAPANTADLPF